MRRVVITGMGALSPVANGARATWDALIAGRSGIERITLFDPSPYPQQLAGEVKNFDNSVIDPKEVRHMDRYTQFAVVAAFEALADSGYAVTPENGPRTGVIIGSIHGKDSNMEDLNTPPPAPAGSPTRTPGSSLFDPQVSPAYTLVIEDGAALSL